MKVNLLCVSLGLLFATHAFAQQPPRNLPAKKKDSIAPINAAKTVVTAPKLPSPPATNTPPKVAEVTAVKNPTLVSTAPNNIKPKEEVTAVKNPTLISADPQHLKPKEELTAVKNPTLATGPAVQIKPKEEVTDVKNPMIKPVAPPTPKVIVVAPPSTNVLKAQLLDAFVTLSTGQSAVAVVTTTNYNKDKDTHWSCGTFDQNGRPVSSFHDDSNNDEYPEGTTEGPLQMHIDNPAVLGDFATNGHIHINIAPNGNDTWQISSFTLALDFQNPSLSQKLTWWNIILSQDKRDIDLYYLWNGKNFVVRQ